MSETNSVVNQKRLARCAYQNRLHSEKKEYMKEIARLLLPQHLRNEESRLVLRAIRAIFEKKFPDLIGKDNGCRFRRTVEIDGVRRSIWAEPDISKNDQLFMLKGIEQKKIKEEICSTFGNETDNSEASGANDPKIKKPKIEDEEKDEEEDAEKVEKIKEIVQDIRESAQRIEQHSDANTWVLPSDEDFHAAFPPCPPSPRLFDAVYPEHRTPFGISYSQQLEYETHYQELVSYQALYPLNIRTLPYAVTPMKTVRIPVQNPHQMTLNQIMNQETLAMGGNQFLTLDPPIDTTLFQPFQPTLHEVFAHTHMTLGPIEPTNRDTFF